MTVRCFALLILTHIFISTAGIAQSKNLETAFNANSVKLLKAYMDKWSSDIKPISVRELNKLPNELRQAYQLFETFYNPHNLANLGAAGWYKDTYKNYHYYVIQNNINIYQVDRIYKTDEEVREFIINYISKTYKDEDQKQRAISNVLKANMNSSVYEENLGPNSGGVPDSSRRLLFSLNNFRPRMVQVQAIPLYLDSINYKALTEFLGNDHEPFGQSNAMTIARAKGISLKKQEFLDKIIKVNHNHWGNGWEVNTPPHVTITFDKEFRYAKINYGMVYEAGYAFYEFRNGKWEFLKSRLNWRE